MNFSKEYEKEFSMFNIFVLEDNVKEEGPKESRTKEYCLESIGRDGIKALHDYYDYNYPNRVINEMKKNISMGTAPVGVAIISKIEPYFREVGENFSKKQSKNLENCHIIGYVELDNNGEAYGVGRKLTEDEMKYFVSRLTERLLEEG